MDKKGDIDLGRIVLMIMLLVALTYTVYLTTTIAKALFIPEEQPEYCKTTFQNGVVKYCEQSSCYSAGCNFRCSDGTEIDSSYYTVECGLNG